MKPFNRHIVFLFSITFMISINVYSINIYSRQTGNWTDVTSPGTWSTTGLGGADCNCTPAAGDNVIIGNGNVVTFDAGANVTINGLQIDAGGSKLTMSASNKLTVNTGITLNGTIDGASTSNIEIAATAPGSLFSGTGTFSMSGADLKMINNITIPAGSDLKFNAAGKFRLNGLTVTNNGKVQIIDPSDLSNTTGSVWNNASSTSYLYYASNTNFGVNNTLTATAVGNTIEFGMTSGSNAMDATGSYFNLIISGAGGTKKLKTNVIIAGDLTINSTATNVLDFNGNNMTLAGNFTNNGTITPGSQSLTLNGTSAQTLSGSTSFYNLTVNNTSATIPQITLGADFTVQNILSMTSGIINLAGYTLTLGSLGVASALTRTASTTNNWLYGGTFKRYWLTATTITSTSGNYYGLFPMGTSSTSSYRPVEINTTANPTGGGYFTVNHTDNSSTTDLSPTYNDGGTSIVRIHNAQFNTAVSGVTGGTYNISVTMTGLSAGTLSDIRLAIYTGGTTASAVGTHAAATGTAANPTAIRTGITTLTNFNNDFRISTSNAGSTPLPIELTSFKATPTNNTVELNWTTATETNNDYFTVEKSKDAVTYESIGIVNGAGNSTSLLKYSMVDTDPYQGISYYRLKQTDFNGKYSYSNIVVVEIGGVNNINFNIYPNPSNGENVNLSYVANKGDEVLVEVYDAMGKKSYSKVLVTQIDGNNVSAIDESKKLVPGIYFITATSNQTIYSKKLIVK